MVDESLDSPTAVADPNRIPEGAEFRAGARVLRLVSALVTDGLTETTMAAWGALPELAELLGEFGDAEIEAAEHHELFVLNVLPYAGVFLDLGDESGGDSAANVVARTFAEAKFELHRHDLRADHLSAQLEYVAWCLDRGPAGGELALRFIESHLLGWLPQWVFSVERLSVGRYGSIAGFLLEWVLELSRRLESRLGPGPVSADTLPGDAENLLDSERTGVREIAEYLTTPVRAGFYLGRGDVSRLARRAEAPRGFGGRRLMMENVLRSAALYDALGILFAELDTIALDTRTRWERLVETPAARWVGPWVSRIDVTRNTLAEMERRLAAGS